jgi:hypothetical protein
MKPLTGVTLISFAWNVFDVICVGWMQSAPSAPHRAQHQWLQPACRALQVVSCSQPTLKRIVRKGGAVEWLGFCDGAITHLGDVALLHKKRGVINVELNWLEQMVHILQLSVEWGVRTQQTTNLEHVNLPSVAVDEIFACSCAVRNMARDSDLVVILLLGFNQLKQR